MQKRRYSKKFLSIAKFDNENFKKIFDLIFNGARDEKNTIIGLFLMQDFDHNFLNKLYNSKEDVGDLISSGKYMVHQIVAHKFRSKYGLKFSKYIDAYYILTQMVKSGQITLKTT